MACPLDTHPPNKGGGVLIILTDLSPSSKFAYRASQVRILYQYSVIADLWSHTDVVFFGEKQPGPHKMIRPIQIIELFQLFDRHVITTQNLSKFSRAYHP